MRIGFLVTDPAYRDFLIPLLSAALARGDEVEVFLMDEGCFLAADAQFSALLSRAGANASICDFNRTQKGITAPPSLRPGSQYDNARMVQDCDKVLVF